jgi:hypothetical protein
VLGSGHADGCTQLWNARPALVGDIASDGKLSRNAGAADLGAGQRRLTIAHGLKGRPRAVGAIPSKGGPSPDVTVSDNQLVLEWPSNPGALSVYWTAEL